MTLATLGLKKCLAVKLILIMRPTIILTLGLLASIAPAQKLTAKQIYSKFRSSVVQIESNTGAGCGVFYRKPTWILTCAHVIQGATTLTVKDDHGHTLQVDNIALDKAADLAILEIHRFKYKYEYKGRSTTIAADHDLSYNELDVLSNNSSRREKLFARKGPVNIDGITPLEPANFAKLSTGDNIFVIGDPLGAKDTLSAGIVSARRKLDNVPIVQITAAVSHGNSGGPVITENGKLAGVVSFSLVDGQNLNFAVSTDWADQIADKYRRTTTLLFLAANEPDVLPLSALTGGKTTTTTPPTPELSAEEKRQAFLKEFSNIWADYLRAYALDQIEWEAVLKSKAAYLSTTSFQRLSGRVEDILVKAADSDMTKWISSEQAKTLQDKFMALFAKQVDFRISAAAYIDAVNTANDVENAKDKYFADARMHNLAQADITDYLRQAGLLDHMETLVRMLPPPAVTFGFMADNLKAMPDLDFDNACVINSLCVGAKPNQLQGGDTIIGIRASSDETMIPVKTWTDLFLAIIDHQLTGSVAIQVKRDFANSEFLVDIPNWIHK